MSTITSLIKSGAWLSVANIISKLTNALALPIIARLLGPQSLGIYNIVISLAQTVQGFSGLGIEIALQRNGARHQTIGTEAIGRLFGVAFTLICSVNVVMGLGVWLFRKPLAEHWLTEPGVSPWLGAAAILAGLQPLGNIPLLFLVGLQDFRAYAIRSSLGLIVGNTVTLLSAWQFGLKGAIGGLILSAVLQIVWSYLIVKPVLQAKAIHLRFDHFWQEVRSILKFGLPYYLGTNLLFSLINLPLMGLVSHYSGLESLGYLRAAQNMGSLVGFIPLAIAPAVISHLSASSTNEGQHGYLKSVHLRSVWILLLLSSSTTCLFLPNLITWLFGTDYQPAIILAWLFLWASVLTGITAVSIQYLVVDGKTARVGWGSTIGAVCWVLPALVLIPRYGALGFLISHVTSSIVEVLLLVYPAIANVKSEDLLLLRNLTGLSGFLFLWTLIVFLLHLNNILTYLLSLAIAMVAVLFIFMYVLHSAEQLKVKKALRSMAIRVGL
ncbi:MAG: oligosaccharide flippase family protein [Nostoc sp. NOS(2021)]|uniref:lipopolysaccharide biosynthesis protein n=1 Tax=Nostoc sp. NOS(2021) TaxID=2815407 RepID=UPI0025EF9D19|nr:oligosaccharide flippase family protein [Nostoc sp. NOS(2021)]MBN3894914.1 oligosaccharide flippase family protein [Nostoc sp. NOS(2021)]